MIEKIDLKDLPKNNILVYGEIYAQELKKPSLEILIPLKKIAEILNKKLILICLVDSWENIKNQEEIKRSLADEIWIVKNEELKDFRDDLYAKVLVKIIKHSEPCGFFFPATNLGVSLASRIAGILKIGLCAHVNNLEVENGQIVMSRPAFGENIIVKLVSQTLPVMATISSGSFPIKYKEFNSPVKEIVFPLSFSWDSKLKIRKIKPLKEKFAKLTEAKIIIAGGRGLKTKENFEKLFELAQILGAEVGATRPVCYEGWADEERMIGISGASVKPKVYIGFGISGALQHVAGMQNSEFIIAVNIDKSAPLVKIANLSLIGDASKILDILIKKLKLRVLET